MNPFTRTASVSVTVIYRQSLRPGDIRRLEPVTQTIRVIAGNAWVAAGRNDYSLRPGDSLRLDVQTYPAVVSAVGNTLLRYETETRQEQPVTELTPYIVKD
jgi:hypothetical protein